MKRFIGFVFLFSYAFITFATDLADLLPDSPSGQTRFLIKRGFWDFPLSAHFYNRRGEEKLRFLALGSKTSNEFIENEFIDKETNDYQPNHTLNNLTNNNQNQLSAVNLLLDLQNAIKTHKKVLIISSASDLYILHKALEKLFEETEFSGVNYLPCSIL